MKILWFTNTSCSLAKKENNKSFGGGWMVAMENQLNSLPNVELYVSFYQNKSANPIKYGNTSFYPVLRKKTIISEIKRRIFGRYKNDEKEFQNLLNVVKTVNPDIIHIHGTEDNFGLIQKYVSQPVVVSIQGILNPCCEKFFSGISKTIAQRNEPLRSRITFATQIKNYRMFKFMANRELDILKISKHIIGRTNWDRRVTSILSQNGKYHHVDELMRKEFYNQTWKKDIRSSEELQIITTASNNIYKGLETIVKTAAILHHSTNQKFSWHIVGLSEHDAIVKMTVRWLKTNLEVLKITLHGRLSSKDFIPLMLKSDVYCQASHIENSPNSLCEAMCLGMPIVATFAGGTESILKNNKEGTLIQDGDPYSMAGALLEIKSNPVKTIEMARNARERALTRHDYKKVVKELLNVYTEIS